MSPCLPITAEEIAREAIEAAEAGASIVQLHARKPESGQALQDPALFRAFLPVIAQRSDAVIKLTKGGAPNMLLDERLQPALQFKPSFFVQSVLGLLGGIGTHLDDVMHMRSTAERLFGKD